MKHMNEYHLISTLGLFNGGAVWLKWLIRNWEIVDATVGVSEWACCSLAETAEPGRGQLSFQKNAIRKC
jgi:hypothetical protein